MFGKFVLLFWPVLLFLFQISDRTPNRPAGEVPPPDTVTIMDWKLFIIVGVLFLGVILLIGWKVGFSLPWNRKKKSYVEKTEQL